MSPENFVYWLQGFAEIGNESSLDAPQWQIIKDHLSLVLSKETPDRSAIQKAFEVEKRPGGGLYTTLPHYEPAPRMTNPNDFAITLTC